MTEEQFKDITEWQVKTFGQSNCLSKIYHLEEEVHELIEELKENPYSDKTDMEYADCFILLFGSAASRGMDYNYIIDIINKKMDINKTRTWGIPNKNGVVNHEKI